MFFFTKFHTFATQISTRESFYTRLWHKKQTSYILEELGNNVILRNSSSIFFFNWFLCVIFFVS